ncbi:hypothetical protein AMTR_s00010p00126170 [Amborella trichopoda]|uniref:Uncharacterized protein n=1 Tax=Amborella trichopoda TaxID=13333 RepID=W1NE93_AMBTC|nr:hypothetical protein AMTR_s00010p00126170 [Amborella trichopoda]
MIVLKRKKHHGFSWKGIVTWCWVLLVVCLQETKLAAASSSSSSCSSSSVFKSARKEMLSGLAPLPIQRGNKNAPSDSEKLFEQDKRKIHTGPNPLHNK